jgi:hypothetical protein
LADALGFKRTLDGVLEMEEGGRVSVDFFLRPDPIPLDSLAVEAERQRIERHLELQGYYDRKGEGFGHFIAPEEIERREVRDFHRLFQRVPVRVEGGLRGTVLHVTGRCPLHSYPTVFVDGARVDFGWGRYEGGGLEDVVGVSDVSAIEVYTGPASTPLQWSGTKLEDTCGTIVIWTRGG